MNSIFNNTLKGAAEVGNPAVLLQQLQTQQANYLPMQPNFSRTVFTDISEELNKCSNEEKAFIEHNEEYQKANLVYMQNFNAFLLELVGAQFVASKYGPSAEKLLQAIKNARNQYHTHTAEDFAKVKSENKALQEQLTQLQQTISQLHAQGLIGQKE